jgi:hypothetical protein
LMPQVKKSIWPLGPLNAVISSGKDISSVSITRFACNRGTVVLVAPLDPQPLEEMTLTSPLFVPPPELLEVPLAGFGG